MAVTATLEEASVLVEGPSLQNQHKLIAQAQARVERAERLAQVNEALERLRKIGIQPDSIDSAEAIQRIRDERLEQLCQNDA